MGAAFEDPARDLYLGLARVVALVLVAAPRIFGNAAGLRRIDRMLRGVEIGRPLPDVPDHVVKPVSVGREGGNRGGALEPVFSQVLLREGALPGVRHVPTL